MPAKNSQCCPSGPKKANMTHKKSEVKCHDALSCMISRRIWILGIFHESKKTHPRTVHLLKKKKLIFPSLSGFTNRIRIRIRIIYFSSTNELVNIMRQNITIMYYRMTIRNSTILSTDFPWRLFTMGPNPDAVPQHCSP